MSVDDLEDVNILFQRSKLSMCSTVVVVVVFEVSSFSLSVVSVVTVLSAREEQQVLLQSLFVSTFPVVDTPANIRDNAM